MQDHKMLDQVALNKREVTHPRWGSFIIRRPTNRVLSTLETLRTRSMNRDLQQKDIVEDPLTGEKKFVPAFLTERRKLELLDEMGEWTEKDRIAVIEAERAYRVSCLALDDAGYVGTYDLVNEYQELHRALLDEIGPDLAIELTNELSIAFPVIGADPHNIKTFRSAPEGYPEARSKIESTAKSFAVRELLERVDELHKQYSLLNDGVEAQTQMYIAKSREVTLLADTVESRAESQALIGKIFHCTRDMDDNPVWGSMEECEDSAPELLRWLIAQIQAFERLDPEDTEEDRDRMEKFNFLSWLLDENVESAPSPEEEPASPDGQPQEKTPTASTEVSEPQVQN